MGVTANGEQDGRDLEILDATDILLQHGIDIELKDGNGFQAIQKLYRNKK